MGTKNINELVVKYAKYAQHGGFTEIGDYKKGNEVYKKLYKVYQKIKGIDALSHPKFKELLYSPDLGIQLWAAAHSLAVSPKEAEIVLTNLEKIPNSLVGFSAEMTLKEL